MPIVPVDGSKIRAEIGDVAWAEYAWHDVTAYGDTERRYVRGARVADQEELRHLREERGIYERRYSAVYSTGALLTTGDFSGAFLNERTPEEARRFQEDYERDRQEIERRTREGETRALTLLEEHIGPAAVASIRAGGAYSVKSKHWERVVYLVPRDPHERIKVMHNGAVVTESCLVTSDSALPWPDVMLQRIRAVEMDEGIVFSLGVVYDKRSASMRSQALSFLRRIRGRA